MNENNGRPSDNSLWAHHFWSFMVAGIVGCALELIMGTAYYTSYFAIARNFLYQIPYFNDIFLFFDFYLEPTLLDLALAAFVKKMNGRFYGVFVLAWVVAMVTSSSEVILFLNSLGIGFLFSYATLLISLLEGISLWTSRTESKNPPLTTALALLTALGLSFFSFIITLFVGPLIPALSSELFFEVMWFIDFAYASLISVLFMLLFYLEIKRPSLAEKWDMQRSTISPQP